MPSFARTCSSAKLGRKPVGDSKSLHASEANQPPPACFLLQCTLALLVHLVSHAFPVQSPRGLLRFEGSESKEVHIIAWWEGRGEKTQVEERRGSTRKRHEAGVGKKMELKAENRTLFVVVREGELCLPPLASLDYKSTRPIQLLDKARSVPRGYFSFPLGSPVLGLLYRVSRSLMHY